MARRAETAGEDGGEVRWTTTTWIPQISEDLQVRVDRIERELKLEKRAAEDGAAMQPAQSDAMLNKPQAEVCDRIFEGILTLNAFLNSQIDAALSRARALLKEGALDLEAIKREMTEQVSAVFVDRRSDLREARRADLQASRELRKFKYDNALTRKAHYKGSLQLVFAILLAMLLAESLLNGALLSTVMPGGVAEGAGIAALISGINILLGVSAGFYGWRFIMHRRPALKLLGAVVAGVCHGAALAWNMLIGHFRDVAEIMASNPNAEIDLGRLSVDTMRHFSEHGPLGMSSVQSWALLLLGLFVHFYSAKEGWDDIADRYPDYKKYDVHAVETHNHYLEVLETLRQEARRSIETVEQRIKTAAAQAQRNAEAIANLLDAAVQRREEVRSSEDKWVAGGTRLLKLYRDKNIQIRDEKTAPAYFDIYPSAQDYRNHNYGGLPKRDDILNKYRDIDQQFRTLESFVADAKTQAGAAGELVREASRHAGASIAALDDRMTLEESEATKAGNKDLDDAEGDAARAPAPANDREVRDAVA